MSTPVRFVDCAKVNCRFAGRANRRTRSLRHLWIYGYSLRPIHHTTCGMLMHSSLDLGGVGVYRC